MAPKSVGVFAPNVHVNVLVLEPDGSVDEYSVKPGAIPLHVATEVGVIVGAGFMATVINDAEPEQPPPEDVGTTL